MNELEKYRKEIDEIDDELVKLFERRMDICIEVGKYKKKNSINVLDSSRETAVIEKNIKRLKNSSYSDVLKKFFENIMSLSRSLQNKIVK